MNEDSRLMHRALTVKEVCAETGLGRTLVCAIKRAMAMEGKPWAGNRIRLVQFEAWRQAHPYFRERVVYRRRKE